MNFCFFSTAILLLSLCSGYQFFEVKGCLITAKRDMVYYVRCLTTDVSDPCTCYISVNNVSMYHIGWKVCSSSVFS